jgi:hypothetical protein
VIGLATPGTRSLRCPRIAAILVGVRVCPTEVAVMVLCELDFGQRRKSWREWVAGAMTSLFRKMIGVLSWMVFPLTPAVASDKAADLGVSFTVQPSTLVLPNSVGSVTVVVTNAGPDTVPAFVVRSSHWDDGQQILLFPTPDTQCDFSYGFYDGPTLLVYAVLVFNSPLSPGTRQSCTFGVTTYPKATGQYRMDFTVATYLGGPSDPNLSNNQSPTVALVLSPPLVVPTVPTVSRFGLLLMALSIALLGSFARPLKLRSLLSVEFI